MRRTILIINVIFLVVIATTGDVAKAEHEDGIFPLKKTVTITNTLESKAQLKLHCRSKDDDLGVRHLGYNQSSRFKFRTDIFFRTLFYCSFEWRAGVPGGGKVHWDEVYNDWEMNCIACKYIVKPFGLCKFNSQTHQYDKCGFWKNEH
ncbi:unnamed protein product [Linum tenue]|uniref:S-protein homolog n=1 Tax=Linum tenue TaxID=586396 RepID=A0AAV0IFC8_9ROSI|nr:unnamed protein product [Linum tenue]